MACVIAAEAVEIIRAHSAGEYPRESCGLLVGHDAERRRRTVAYAVTAGNVAEAASRRFTIAPEDFLRAESEARERGLEVVGFYHSHPDAAPLPSRSDLGEAWPHYSYLIVAVHEGRVSEPRCWRLEGGAFVEEAIEIDGAGAVRTP
jgi:proteasome lid subunit RPN8/RPN11